MSLAAVRLRNVLARSLPLRLRKLVPEKIFRHFYPKGIFWATYFNNRVFKLWSGGHQIENEIYWRGLEGSLEQLSVKLWINFCETLKPKVVWDVGANTGTYAVIAKTFNLESEVHLFEPLDGALNIAKRNFAINNYEGIFYNTALGNYSGTGRVFLESSENFGYGVTLNMNYNPPVGMRELKIRVEKAKEFINSIEEIPKLVKLDVESFEPEVLEGFEGVDISETIFLIEILNDEIALKLQKFFPRDRFMFLNINDRNNTCRWQDKLTKSDFYNFACIPQKLNLETINELQSKISAYLIG